MARLYNWYIEKINKYNNDSELWARGIVSGHVRLPDGMFIHTSAIASVIMEGETAIIQTKNTRFECKMENADYAKFIETELIEGFEEFKDKYDIPKVRYESDLQENEVLLILGNNRQYYFDSYHVNHLGKKESLYDVHPHVGMFQDSVLCQCFIDRSCIDYRYFPYKGCHVEFYEWEDHFKTYIENCGDDPLYVTVYGNVYIVPPKERVLIIPQNAEKEEPHLGHTDLYNVWDRENEQKEEVTHMKILKKRIGVHMEERKNISKFAKEHLDFLLEGDYDGLKRRVDKFTNKDDGFLCYEVWKALLKEAIVIGEVNHLYYLCEQMYTVPLIEEFDMETFRNADVPIIEEWYETELEDTESPFISLNDDQLNVLMEFNWDRRAQRLMWEDGEKMYLVDATPMAAALATGEIDLFERFLEKEGWRGFYNDDKETEAFFWRFTEKKKSELATVFFDEIMSNQTCRIASPEEAALLSGRLDVIRKVFENQNVEKLMERLSSRAIERNGQFYYREEYGMHLPDAIYWLNEEESLYIDRTYPMLHQYYELNKIIESANYVLLASYLNEHESMKNTIVEEMITRIKTLNIPKLTFEMLEEMAKLSDRHCVPISRKWLEQRKEFCIETLKAYLLGRRAFTVRKDDTVKSDLYQKHTELNENPGWNSYEQTDEEEDGWSAFQKLSE